MILKQIKKFPLKRTLKITGWTILGIIVAANLFILISGKFHLYKAIRNTILEGRLMPTIHEYQIFHNRTIEANNPIHWPTQCDYAGHRLRDTDIEKFNSIETESYLIIRNDSLYFEQYWPEYYQYNADSISNSFSVAKSIVSILIGIAIDEGKIGGLEDKVADYIPAFKKGDLGKITIRHTLNMSTGLNWDESSSPLSDNTEAYYGWDLLDMVENQEALEEPGKQFNYLSGNTQIAAFCLEKAIGKPISEYASEKLWTPLNATHNALWNLDEKDGMEKAFCCFYATTRDFARIGQLFLRNGKWGNKQIVSSAYVKESTTPADIVTEDGSENKKYGLSWWLDNYNGLEIQYARGILGQYIIVIPRYDLVVVRTGYQRGEKLDTDHPEDLYWYIDAALAMIGK